MSGFGFSSGMKKSVCIAGLVMSLIMIFTCFAACGHKSTAELYYDEVKSITDTNKNEKFTYISVDVEMYKAEKEQTFYPGEFYIIESGDNVYCKSFLHIESSGATIIGDEVFQKFSVSQNYQQTIPAKDGGVLYLYFDIDFEEEQNVYYRGLLLQAKND